MACGEAHRLLLLRSRILAHRGPKQQLQGVRWVGQALSPMALAPTDLAHNPTKCTLAYFHDPLYASGSEHDSPQVKDFWDKLYDQHADVILSGNAHRYERYARITPSGERSSARGIRQ